MMPAILSLVLVACLSGDLFGQCCAQSQIQEQRHGWYASEKYADSVDYYWRGDLCGTLDPATGTWRSNGKEHSVDLCSTFSIAKIPNEWLPRGEKVPSPLGSKLSKECLCDPNKCECAKCHQDCVARRKTQLASPDPASLNPNQGVYWTAPVQETIRVNGHHATRAEAMTALGGKPVAGGNDPVPDDSTLLRVTVVSDDAAKRSQVLNDLDASPILSQFKGKLVAQGFPASSWQMSQAGFVAGNPSIYIQSPTGKVLHRQDDYADGPSGLATALRKSGLPYDPSKDPDARKEATTPASSSKVNYPAALGSMGVIAVCAFAFGVGHRRKKK